MSAFVVDKHHIDAVVRYACQRERTYIQDPRTEQYRYLDWEDAEWLGSELWTENAASVAYRYGSAGDLPGPVDFTPEQATGYTFTVTDMQRPQVSAVAVLKACNSLEYQSCEHPGWETSTAKAILQAIRDGAIRCLPGYEEADWEIVHA